MTAKTNVPIAANPNTRPRNNSNGRTGLVVIVYIVLLLISAGMLKQLIKPYYYSSDCIYWDFSAARWKYFKEQYNVKQVDNPDAQLEDRLVEYLDINKDELLYRENKTYIVRERKEQMDIYFDRDYAEYYLELFREDYNLAVKKRAKILKEGDLVTFRSNRKRK